MSHEPQKPKVLGQANELAPQIDQATQVFPAEEELSLYTLIRGLQTRFTALGTRT